jgi:hypothetical protein
MRITTLSSTHRHYLILEQGIAPSILNFFINGAIAWFFFRSLTLVPLWGSQSIAGDTIATAFFLPFISCLISTPLAHWDVRRGRITPVAGFLRRHSILQKLFDFLLLRAISFGSISMITVSAISLFALIGVGIHEFSFWQFLIFKASFAACLAMLVSPIIGWCALGDSEAHRNYRRLISKGDR